MNQAERFAKTFPSGRWRNNRNETLLQAAEAAGGTVYPGIGNGESETVVSFKDGSKLVIETTTTWRVL